MSIWTGKYIFQLNNEENLDSIGFNKKFNPDKSEGRTDVLLLGGGVDAFNNLLELIEEYRQKPHRVCNIYWFDKRGLFAEGKEFFLEQPEFHLYLCPIGEIDLIESTWNKTGIEVPEHVSVLSWVNSKLLKKGLQAVGFDWIAKRVLGLYLNEMLAELAKSLPPSISIFTNKAEIVSVFPLDGSFEVRSTVEDVVCDMAIYDDVKIAISQYPFILGEEENSHVLFSTYTRDAKYFGNPKRNCSLYKSIRKTDQVVIAACNEYFYDCILMLTEGRGGKFVIQGGKLVYNKSGNEPLSILPFFPYGLPFLADLHAEYVKLEFKNLTEEWEQKLLKKAASGPIDFDHDILRVFVAEIHQSLDLGDFSTGDSSQFLETLLQELVERSPESREDFHQGTITHLNQMIYNDSQRDVYLISAIWKRLLPLIKYISVRNGFLGSGYERFATKYKQMLDWLILKVPPVYIWKLLALAEARILFFRLGPDTHVSEHLIRGKFKADSYQTKFIKEANVYINTAGSYNPHLDTDSEILRYLNFDGKTNAFENN